MKRRFWRHRGNFDFIVGRWQVRVADGTLSDGRSVIRLEPRVMGVLAFLAARPGQVVTKPDLVRAVWGNVHVTDGAIVRSVVLLRKSLEDDARSPAYVRTLSKRGYQLIAKVEPASGRGAGGTRFATGALIALLIAAGSLMMTGHAQPEGPLVVEPFLELDPLARQEEWSRSLSAELSARLSGSPVDVVFSQASSPPNAARVDDDKPAKGTILTGSVRREGSRARIACRLSEAATLRQVCAGSCDLAVTSRIDAQRQASDRIARAVEESLPQVR